MKDLRKNDRIRRRAVRSPSPRADQPRSLDRCRRARRRAARSQHETLALVLERGLAVVGAVDHTRHLVVAGGQCRCIRDHERCVGPADLTQELVDRRWEFGRVGPSGVAVDLPPREVVDALDPVQRAWGAFDGDGHRGRVPPQHRLELAVQREVAASRPVAEEEVVGTEVALQHVEQSAVRGFEDRLVLVGRADHRSPPDLAVDDVVVHPPERVVVGLHVLIEGQQPAGLLDVGLVGPAVVVHQLGHPLVGEVLDQSVDECERAVRRREVTARVLGFESVDLRARVDHRLDESTLVVGEGEHRDDLDRYVGEVVPPGVAQHPPERQAPVAQHRSHLHGVRRAEGAADRDREWTAHGCQLQRS